MAKHVAKMAFNAKGGPINWFPGHMAVATRVIRERLKLADMVIEVRDARIPVSSAYADIQDVLSRKRRIIVLNKKDLGNPNMIKKWTDYFHERKLFSYFTNAHRKSDVQELLHKVELQLKDAISRQPTLLVMVIGIPNVGKSVLINSIYQISRMRFPVKDKLKKATVGPLPGVTQDISGFKIAQQPSIYVLDTPGVLTPKISDIETGLKLALTGAVKDSIVGEDRLARYLLALLNTRRTPMHWKNLCNISEGSTMKGPPESSKHLKKDTQKEDQADEAKRALFKTISEFHGDFDAEDDLEQLIEVQFAALQRAFRVPPNTGEAGRNNVSRRLLQLFRIGKLGHFVLDHIPEIATGS